MITTETLANTLILRARARGERLSKIRLQRTCFVIATEHAHVHDQALLMETFQAWDLGPVLPGLYAQMTRVPRWTDEALCHDATGSRPVLGMQAMTEIETVVTRVEDALRGLDDRTLIQALREPGSAWDRAWQARRLIIEHTDMAHDVTYKAALGLT